MVALNNLRSPPQVARYRKETIQPIFEDGFVLLMMISLKVQFWLVVLAPRPQKDFHRLLWEGEGNH